MAGKIELPHTGRYWCAFRCSYCADLAILNNDNLILARSTPGSVNDTYMNQRQGTLMKSDKRLRARRKPALSPRS